MLRYHEPSEEERRGSRRRKVLWLLGGQEPLRRRDPSCHMPAVAVFWPRRSARRPWLGRLVGVDEALDLEIELELEYRLEGDGEDRWRLYEELTPGRYLAESAMVLDGVGVRAMQRVFFDYSEEEGFVLRSRQEVFDTLRPQLPRAMSFGDVRGLVAEGDFEQAERVALWLERLWEREQALSYLESHRHQRQRGLPELEGRARRVEEAGRLRHGALMRVREVERPQREAIRAWLIEQTQASFWIEHRHALFDREQLQDLWRRQGGEDDACR